MIKPPEKACSSSARQPSSFAIGLAISLSTSINNIALASSGMRLTKPPNWNGISRTSAIPASRMVKA
jgi:hypothetical protein